MKTKIEYGLEGAFKVDLYSGKTLINSTDYFSNFITPTGLHYPNIYAFADCFRYLSIGSNGSIYNSGAKNPLAPSGTTGLAAPIVTYETSDGNQVGQWIDWRGYETGSQGSSSACGTQIGAAGPRFFRAWSIPTGAEDITIQDSSIVSGLQIEEFMVSPSSGGSAKGRNAFSRVRRSVFIPNGHRAIITYQLKVNVQNTGRTFFNSGTFATGNAETGNDLSLIREWGNLSGYYRQVWHGLRCIDKNGVTFIPKFGDGLEPSCRSISSLSFYFSPDNSQFDVNGSGGLQTSESLAYAADGLMAGIGKQGFNSFSSMEAFDPSQYPDLSVIYTGDNATLNSSIPSETTPKNIRLGSPDEYLRPPKLTDYSQNLNPDTNFNYQNRQDPDSYDVSFATPGVNGWNDSIEDYGQKAIFSTKTTQLPYRVTGLNAMIERVKTVTRKAFFSPISSLGYNTRLGSLVYAYKTPDQIYYPIIDTLFYDSSGRSLMRHYRLISGIQMIDRGNGVAWGYINIRGSGNVSDVDYENIERFNSKQLFFGPITGVLDPNNPVIFDDVGETDDLQSGYLFDGAINNTSGDYVTGDVGFIPILGHGAVYGLLETGYKTKKFDCGIIDHRTGDSTPSNTGAIYWPYISTGTRLILEFTGLRYFCPDDFSAMTTGEFQNGNCVGYSGNIFTGNLFPLHGTNYRAPSGYFLHYESIGSSGNRLLPNHALPNHSGVNYYPPLYGGSYPALSMDNGMEVFLDITWSSPCGVDTQAGTC